MGSGQGKTDLRLPRHIDVNASGPTTIELPPGTTSFTIHNDSGAEIVVCFPKGTRMVTPEEASQPPEVVHVLREGYPLCGFSSKAPVDWPAGHKWIGPPDVKFATCGGCLARLWTGPC
jgi:hypothetical protein